MMSEERELLKKVIRSMQYLNYSCNKNLRDEITELLAQPKQTEQERLSEAFRAGKLYSYLSDQIRRLTAENAMLKEKVFEQEPKIEFRGLGLNGDSYSQEPVAWLITATSCGGAQDWKVVSLERKAPEKLERMFPKFTPLYTSPQREPSASAREMYQRGYAQAELDSKCEQEPGIVEDSMVDEAEKSRWARECENHAWKFRELEQQMTVLRNESHIPNNPGYLMLLNFLIQEYAMSGLIRSEPFDTIRAALKKDQGITLD